MRWGWVEMGGTAERYTTRDAAKITGLSPARIRYYVRGGLVAAGGDKAGPYRYSFHDLLLLKTTKRLREAGVSLQQIRRAFASLNEGDARSAPLTRLAIAADGDRVVVARGGARWRPESGQLVLRFESRGPGAAAGESLMPQASTGPLAGHEWYDVGVGQGAVRPVAGGGGNHPRGWVAAFHDPELHRGGRRTEQ